MAVIAIIAALLIEQVAQDQQPFGVGHGRQQFGGFIRPRFELCDLHLDILEYSNI